VEFLVIERRVKTFLLISEIFMGIQ